MKILAIETSCDETAVALIEAKGGLLNPKFYILNSLVASQIKIHRPFGGVVPNLAKREHLRNLPILYKRLLASGYTLNPDLIAVTVGPGLEPCLWTGINFAKELYVKSQKSNVKCRLLGTSHLEGHLYSFLLSYRDCFASLAMTKNIFPAVALIISGGHTILLLMKDLTHYKKLGETRDDAVGEAFDKVARLLDLPYPGGPEIEKIAKYGSSTSIDFPRPMMNQKNYDFSFSGLKTAVLYYLRDAKNANTSESHGKKCHCERSEAIPITKRLLRANALAMTAYSQHSHPFVVSHRASDVAASFQAAAFDVLISKTLRAAKKFNAKSIMISGGVAANKTLKKEFMSKVKSQMSNVNFLAPPKNFCADNAAMVAVAGYINYLRKKNRRLVARGDLGL